MLNYLVWGCVHVSGYLDSSILANWLPGWGRAWTKFEAQTCPYELGHILETLTYSPLLQSVEHSL